MLSAELLSRGAQAGAQVALVDGIARVELNREGGNRFSHDLIVALRDVFSALSASSEVRSVVLFAAGADFSFGADLTDQAMTDRVAGSRDERMGLAELGRQAVDAWATLPVPTVAVGQGRIIGAGACFFCTADFPFAFADAAVHFPEIDRGMHLSWGIIPRLVARFGLPLAASLALLGEPMPCGLLPRPPLRIADAPLAEAEALAFKLAAKPPLAVRAIKRALVETERALGGSSEGDAARFADTVGSADFAEAMAAWFEKRPGKFRGR